jgi:hypothetical protein
MDTEITLNSRQEAALRSAVGKWDGSLSGSDMRTYGALYRRGLVSFITSPYSYYSNRKGWWVTRTTVSDVKITDKGREFIAARDTAAAAA